MNVIAADMCTNARRVRKRWLPKIQSMLPETKESSRSSCKGQSRACASSQTSVLSSAFEMDFRHLTSSYLTLEQQLYAESHKETLLPHLQFVGTTRSEEGAAAAELAESETEPGPERGGRGAQAGQGTERLSECLERAAEVPSLSTQGKAGAGGSPSSKHTGQQDKLLGDDQ